MEIIKRIIYSSAIALFILLFFSCRKFLEIDPPKNLTVTKSVFNSDETAISATLNLYMTMNDSRALPFYISVTAGMYVDELKGYSTFDGFMHVYQNSLSPENNSFLDVWKIGYNIIYQANAIIEGCSESNNISQQIKKQLTAESLFVRAYWFLYLTNFYGDIPILTSTDYTINSIAKKSPVREVYKQIISDLKNAESDLSPDYLSGDSKAISTERIRPNKYSAIALLARVYLYSKDYVEAEKSANMVIEYKAKYSLPSIDNVFLKGSSEAIWQIAQPTPNATTLNTYESLFYTLIGKPTTLFENSTAISSSLLSSFEVNDKRKGIWIGKFTDQTVNPPVDYFYPYKYKSTSNTAVIENTVVLRLAEQHLIRAEARTMLNDIMGAKEDLNLIRERAGLGDVDADNKTDLLEAILRERRIEFFCEWGHRFFDLKRCGKLDEVMSSYTPTKGATWLPYKKNFPIPEKEIFNNPNLKQNDGYNQ